MTHIGPLAHSCEWQSEWPRAPLDRMGVFHMKRIGLIAAALSLVALTGNAAAVPYDGTTCSYTSTATVAVPVGPATVYAGGGGMSGAASAAAGVCVYDAAGVGAGGNTFHGGSVEVGEGAPGAYAVVDGSNQNTDPLGSGDGYVGVSTFETGTKGNCDSGSGTNSGGCLGIKPLGLELPVPLIVCGNTSGNVWADTQAGGGTGRDGCALP